ncbi:MAG: lectin like domain-containing protein, partial [Clostridiales bacterium]|nr:lectin like domain-containing protein [Clostridiales bacterium]
QNSGAWLVKNSWGDDWGDNGYFWISYEDKLAPADVWVIDGVGTFDASEKTYEHDQLGFNGWYSGTTKIFAANVFSVDETGEKLTKVKIFNANSSSQVAIYVIPNYTGKDSLQSVSLSTPDAVASELYPGWYTINLEESVPLGKAGSKFAVVAEYSVSAGGTVKVPIENYSYSVMYDGQSYSSANGYLWTNKNYNFNIKAVTEKTEAIGDINNDMNVDLLDILILRRYILGWDIQVNNLADVNNDRQINMNDVFALRGIISGQ